jgi:glycine cleavage system transcriptional repressor
MLLTITTFGKKETQRIAHVTQVVKECDCIILESRLSTLASDAQFSLLVKGNWNHIAKLENMLEQLAHDLEIKILSNRCEPADNSSNMLPYSAEIFGLRDNDILTELATFFITSGIDIREMSTSCAQAAHTEAPLFTAHFILELPSNSRLITLREDFLDFCDSVNLDAILEPVKR